MDNANGLAFDGEKSFEYLRHLAVQIGCRVTGSAAEHTAARYIAKMFRSFGLKTRLQKFPMLTFDNATCDFAVKDGRKWRAVTATPVTLSKNTPPRGIEGEIHFAHSGEAEYLTPAMRDKIVLVCGHIRADDRPRVISYGPKALVLIDTQIREETIRGGLSDDSRKTYGNLPMVRIRHLDGLDIIKDGLKRAKLTLRNTEEKSHCFNVIGEKAGSEFPDEIAVVCGHYDSSLGISGASDNAGGTAVMMELARVLAATPTKRTLRFVAFAAEETGLNGSRFYADELGRTDRRDRKKASFNEKIDKTERDMHRLAFNLDVHGCILGGHMAMFSGVDDLGASVRLLAKEIGVPCRVQGKPMSSDGTPLAAVGIPTVQLARTGGTTGYLHQTLDDIRYLAPEPLAVAGRFTEQYLRRYVTDSPVFPFPREIPDAHVKDVKKYFTNAKRPIPGEEPEKKKKKPAKKRR